MACARPRAALYDNYASWSRASTTSSGDIYIPGCPPRPEMIFDAIMKLHDQVEHTKLGADTTAHAPSGHWKKGEALRALRPEMKGLLRDKSPDKTGPGAPSSRRPSSPR